MGLFDFFRRKKTDDASMLKTQTLPFKNVTYVVGRDGEPMIVFYRYNSKPFVKSPIGSDPISYLMTIHNPLFIDVTGLAQVDIPPIPAECDSIILQGYGTAHRSSYSDFPWTKKVDDMRSYWHVRGVYYEYENTNRLFFPKSIFPNPIKNQIIFIPSDRAEDVDWNRYIAENLDEIKGVFKSFGCDLFYYPEFLDNITEFIKYNKPDVEPENISYIARTIGNSEFDILKYADNKEILHTPIASAFLSYVSDRNDFDTTSHSFIHFRIDVYDIPEGISYMDIIEWYLRRITNRIPRLCFVDPPIKEETADYYFPQDAQKLTDEIGDKFALLRYSGVSELLLKQIFESTEKLSRLKIDSDYRIFLPDYNNLEINMELLDKAVFLLFLRYEDGILLRNLVDYKCDLTEIYEKIAGCRCDNKQRKNIERICDPTNISINEKCAQIREAFVQHFDERLAKKYYVTGERGEEKKILLSRELVDDCNNIIKIKRQKKYTSVIEKISTITNALRASDLVVIAGVPWMGKTALMNLLAVNYARDNNIPVAIFSIYESTSRLTKRLETYGDVSGLPLYIDDSVTINVDYLYVKAKHLSEVEGVQVIFIDGLALCGSDCSLNILKSMAKELNITFVCLSDIMRFSVLRVDRRPSISDLDRMSYAKNASQYADTILFMYRAYYYNRRLVDNNIAEIIIAKHYDNSLDKVYLQFDNSKRVFLY